ncbi:fimbria/pilus outer membrane usher protein, partial [Stenotrophomonas rhizophila]
GRSPNAHAPAAVSHGASGQQAQLGLSGTLGSSRALSYSLSASDASTGQSNSSAYAAYRGGTGNFSAGYSRSGDYSTTVLGAAGSPVLHAGGEPWRRRATALR